MELWKNKIGNSEAQPIVYNNIIYITGIKNLLAINCNKGDILWEYKTHEEIICKPYIKDNYIYFGDLNGLPYKLDINDPFEKYKYRLIWVIKLDNSIFSSPIIDNNNYLYVGCDDNYLYKINIQGNEKDKSRIVWKFKTKGEIYYNPELHNNKIFITASDQTLYSINQNGQLCWQYTLKEAILSQPFIYNNLIYLGSSNGDILCFTLDGKLIKNIKFNECFFYKPILHNNNIYFFSFYW